MYNMIIREERHVVIAKDQDARVDVVALAARVQDKSGIICNVCKKSGHSSLEYFQVISFLNWWPDKNKTLSGYTIGRGENTKHSGGRWE